MKLAVVLSTHAAQFQAVAFKGDFEANVVRIASYGYDGVELAIRDPKLVDVDQLDAVVKKYGLEVPAIGTGQAWGEEGLSFTSDDLGCAGPPSSASRAMYRWRSISALRLSWVSSGASRRQVRATRVPCPIWWKRCRNVRP